MTRTFESEIPSAFDTFSRTRKIPCVDSHTVRRSPSHSATAPCGSSAVCSWTGVRYSRRTMTSAAFNPASMSPRDITSGAFSITLPLARTFGASFAVASSNVTANGSVSYSTAIACAALRAACPVAAQTAAIGWPA